MYIYVYIYINIYIYIYIKGEHVFMLCLQWQQINTSCSFKEELFDLYECCGQYTYIRDILHATLSYSLSTSGASITHNATQL